MENDQDAYKVIIKKIGGTSSVSPDVYYCKTKESARELKNELLDLAKEDDCPYKLFITIEKNIKHIVGK